MATLVSTQVTTLAMARLAMVPPALPSHPLVLATLPTAPVSPPVPPLQLSTPSSRTEDSGSLAATKAVRLEVLEVPLDLGATPALVGDTRDTRDILTIEDRVSLKGLDLMLWTQNTLK